MNRFADRLDAQVLVALARELVLERKPGLVTASARGSHADMDHHTFHASIAALRGYFGDCARLGARGCDFRALQCRGLRAEQAMFAATGGINTHKGAIFSLGLLSAAAGWQHRSTGGLHPDSLGSVVAMRWGTEIGSDGIAVNHRSEPGRPSPTLTHGLRVRHTLGLPGAREQAAAGFPVLFDTSYRGLRAALRCGVDHDRAGLHALLMAMAVLPDSNLAHRGGLEGLHWAQAQARSFLERGGVFASDWREALDGLCGAFERRRLSPGGSADLLAAAWALHEFETILPAHLDRTDCPHDRDRPVDHIAREFVAA